MHRINGNKIEVIKVIRKYKNVRLADAKFLVEMTPSEVLYTENLAMAERMYQELRELGAEATVEID